MLKDIKAWPSNGSSASLVHFVALPVVLLFIIGNAIAQSEGGSLRTLSGVVLTDKHEVIPNVSVVAEYPSGKKETLTDANGNFC